MASPLRSRGKREMAHVFISYSSIDRDFALRLNEGLLKRGFETWLDKQDLKVGEQWDIGIESAIPASRAFVFVVSPDSINERCIARKELHVAHDAGIRIIPIIYRPCRWRSQLLISDLQHLDYTDPEMPTSNFDTLLDELCRTLLTIADQPNEAETQDVNSEAHQLLQAAQNWFDLDLLDNALNRLKYAEKLNPTNNDILGQILFLKERVNRLVEKRREDENLRRLQEIRDIEQNISEDLTQFAEPGVNDFYGIVKLALAQEAGGDHSQAVRNLWRACKIEPRVKSKSWMTQNFGWSEEQHSLFERILIDLPD